MRTTNQGFTLFFAMLVAALSLSIGLAIYDLTAREIDLSSTATQSQYALYAADMGSECALYWDAKAPPLNGVPSVFATSSASAAVAVRGNTVLCSSNSSGTSLDITTLPPPTQDLGRYPECPSGASGAWCTSSAATAATTTFSVSFPTNTYCAVVQVAKRTVGGIQYTTIVSRGYNTCAGGTVLRVERALQVNY